MRHQLAEHVMKLHNSGAVLHVRGYRRMRLGPQHIVGEAGQIAARPDLQEQPHTIAVHAFDRLAEPHRARPLHRRERADLLGIPRIRAGRHAGIQRALRLADAQPVEMLL